MKYREYYDLTPLQRQVLQCVYDSIKRTGKYPSLTEIANVATPHLRDLVGACAIVKALIKKGWLIRRGRTFETCWPIGVDQKLTFRWPATLFVKGQAEFRLDDEIPKASGKPCTMARFADIVAQSVAMGLHPEDGITLHWAHELLTELAEATKKIGRFPLQGSDEWRLVRVHECLRIQEILSKI